MIRDGTENNLSSCFGNPFRRSLLSIENDLPDAFRNVFNNVNELRILLKTEDESESKKETAKKEKMIIIEGEIIS